MRDWLDWLIVIAVVALDGLAYGAGQLAIRVQEKVRLTLTGHL